MVLVQTTAQKWVHGSVIMVNAPVLAPHVKLIVMLLDSIIVVGTTIVLVRVMIIVMYMDSMDVVGSPIVLVLVMNVEKDVAGLMVVLHVRPIVVQEED